jgi:hypothetical protein
MVETPPQAIAVALADGTLPAMDTGSMLSAIERVRAEIRTEYQAQLFSETDGLRTKVGILESKVTTLQNEREALKKQVDKLSATPTAAVAPAAPASDSIPLFAIVGIAVLAGAISGFAMTSLGRNARPASGAPGGPTEEIGPAGALSTR